jgi:hypothetical protein
MVDVVIDTSIWRGQNFNWSSQKLDKLTQLHEHGLVNIYIPHIVDLEIKGQIEKLARESFASLKKAFDKSPITIPGNIIPLVQAKEYFISTNEDLFVSMAIKDYENFKADLEVKILPLDPQKTNKVVDDYFRTNPPFEEKKKAEFPDAFAIESAKSFFNGQFIVISADGGWRKAFAGHSSAKFYSDLTELFSFLESEIIKEHATLEWAHSLISDNSNLVIALAKDKFIHSGFMATDVADDYIDSIEVNDVKLEDVILDYVSDNEIQFSCTIQIEYTATVDYSDPESWLKDDETKEIIYRYRITGHEITREISFDGNFTLAIDPSTSTVEDVSDYNIAMPDTIYFDVEDYDYYK